MLPGGDSLTAAVAEGRLVSPAMVAAADKRGALSLPVAWLLLATVVIGALVVASQAEVLTVAPSLLPKAPEVLAERCRDILAHIGHRADAADSDFWFTVSADRTATYFVYRQSPRPLVARNLIGTISEADPPSDVPGMATVRVDGTGRLVELLRIGDRDGRGSASAHTPSWSTLFADAALDERQFVAVNHASLPMLPHDSARTWERSDHRGSLRVTTATLGNSPVYFAVAGTADTSMRNGALTTGRSPRGEQILWLFIIAGFVAMSIVARRNLRAGEGDRLNARKIGLFIACAGTFNAALRAHHVPLTVEETTLLLGVTGWALVWAGFAWLAYIGLEPYVRRLWPRTLISWTRLLAGRLRDPLVGRDILAGTVVGVVLTAVLILRFIFVPQPIPEALLEPAIESLASTRLLAWSLTFGVLDAVQFALAALFFIVLIHIVIGKPWIAVFVLSILAAPIAPGGAAGVTGYAWATALLLIFGATLMRVGLLAGVVALGTVRLLTQTPLTLNGDSWYFGSTIVVLVVVAALGVFGFVVSLAGAPAFGVKR
jgi:serine/threonine-protein kinase